MAAQTTESAHRVVDGVALTEYRPATMWHDQTLVFVHGGGHGAWAWRGMQDWFAAQGWRSVAIDWYSHGGSRALPKAEWLRRGIPEVREEIGIACEAVCGPVVVVGHSMGGLASQAFAVTDPSALQALVLLAPVVPGRYAGDPIDIEFDPGSPWLPPPPEVARQLFYSGVDDDLAAEFYAQLQAESPQAVHQATRWTVDLDVRAINVPTLVVGAEQDLLVPAPYVRALATDIGAEYLELPGVGHGVELDPGWPQLADRIQAWLRSVSA